MTRRCTRKGCPRRFEVATTGRPRRFCSATCRVATWDAQQRADARASRKRSVEWYTPPDVFAWFAERWGPFDFDPFASPVSPIWPLVSDHLTREDDALVTRWRGRRGFANPPYGRGILGESVLRGLAAVRAGELEDLVAYLVPLRPSSSWFRQAREAGAEMEPLPRRIRFLELTPDGTLARTSGALFETTALVFRRGSTPTKHDDTAGRLVLDLSADLRSGP